MKNTTQNIEAPELNALEAYRKKQDMPVEVMANGMKVSKDFVRYIETGEFDKLGAPTFIRGHITNYCKMLGLDPAAVLAQMPTEYLQHKQLKFSGAMGTSPLARVKRQSNHLGKYTVGTALLGMLCLSFYFIWDKWSLNETGVVSENIAIADSSDTKADKKIIYSSLIPQVSGPNVVVDDGSNQAVETGDAGDYTPFNSEDSATNETEAVLQEEEGVIAVPSSQPIDSANASTNQITGGYAIKLDLEDQAWVAIKTQNGDNIVQDLLGPGIVEYYADEPIHFRIGNAQSLQISINNNAVELSKHIKKDIADFNWPLTPSS